MAQTLAQIQSGIQTTIRTYPSLNVFLFPSEGGSKVSVFNLIISAVCICIQTAQYLFDTATTTLQTIAAAIPAGNTQWVQKEILAFQYGYVIGFVNNVPAYSTIDTSAQIVTQCSVKQLPSGVVAIKVATGTPPSLTPLSGAQLSALEDYYFGTSTTQGIGFAGIRTSFISLNPDRMMVQANVYYYGQYDPIATKAAVIAAITTFFQTFSLVAFDGTVEIEYLSDAIRAVSGVSRIQFTSILARQATVAIGGATVIDFQGFYLTVAGYIIPEDTSGFTLSSTITMVQETA